ncbi:MAG: LysR family transcriptional regulator [Betaproteobacteria bacterium]|nr:LysR family transcriptional regulator [Betaproteobacteria bacterium]
MAEIFDRASLKLKAQVLLGDSIAIGPGKADLLEAIGNTGSIAAAGRSLGFSYRRTRDMIDILNACWQVPLVTTVKGGKSHGGTSLTPAGEAVLARYRALEAALHQAAEGPAAELLALSGPTDDND